MRCGDTTFGNTISESFVWRMIIEYFFDISFSFEEFNYEICVNFLWLSQTFSKFIEIVSLIDTFFDLGM